MAVVQELVATLGLEVDEQTFNRGLLALKGIALGLAGIGAAVGSAVVGLGAIVQQTANVGDKFNDAAEATGVNAQALQELTHAAEMSGSSFEGLTAGLAAFTRNAGSAVGGSVEARKAFAAIGISMKDLKTVAPDVLFERVADKLGDMPPGLKRSALAMDLFGRSGSDLLPMMADGAKGLQDMRKEAQDLGIVLYKDTVKSAAEFNDNVDRTRKALEGVRNEIGSALLPTFVELTDAVWKWIRANRKLIAAPVIKFFAALKGAVVTLKDNLDLLKGALLLVVSFMVANYLTALSTVTGAQIAWGVASLIAGARAAAGWALATAASWLALAPLALLVAFVALLADEIVTFAEGDDTLLGRWIKWLDSGTEKGHELIEVFKALGSLIFDFTDPKKWFRMDKAIKEGQLWALMKLMEGLVWSSDTLLGTDFAGKRARAKGNLVEQRAPDATPFGFPDFTGQASMTTPLLFGPNSASPAASLAASQRSTSSVYSPNVNADVTVNVGDGVPARETGDAVAKALAGEWWQAPDYAANLVAVDQ